MLVGKKAKLQVGFHWLRRLFVPEIMCNQPLSTLEEFYPARLISAGRRYFKPQKSKNALITAEAAMVNEQEKVKLTNKSPLQ